MIVFENDQLLKAFAGDAELRYKLRGLTAVIRLDLGSQRFDVRVENGVPVGVAAAGEADADMSIAGPASAWEHVLAPVPPRGLDGLIGAAMLGIKTDSRSFTDLLAPYQGALQRMFTVLREIAIGTPLRSGSDPEPYRDTDNAVGRYIRVRQGGMDARVYYEEAGTGDIPLVLQHTAGADSRQYRHVLANPELQKRFRMIAWDLPYHGRSLPPVGVRWWEHDYRPSKEDLLSWSVAISRAIGLDRPIYMGCSVGGQLALDLAAHKSDDFRAFIALNGWYEMRSRGHYDHEILRHPRTSTDYLASRILSAASPLAPEALVQEVYWVYRSNYPTIYPGDNDYFSVLHDMREDGHLIDTAKTPVYALAGTFDPAAHAEEHGSPAIAKNVPGVVYRELPGLGHFAPADDPVRFCETIIPILDEIVSKLR
jgi:pimeloyl-ACP methyl ester carboxylesterase